MDRHQAEHLIQDVVSQPFELERYRHFLRSLLNQFEVRNDRYDKNARLWDAFWPHINHYRRIGKYTDPDGAELDLLVVEVPTFSKLAEARTTLRNLVVKHLKTFGNKNYALVAFYARDDSGADWRFSFVKVEHEAYQDAHGRVKFKQELSPAKRFSFLLGAHENSHTACKQLLPLLTMDTMDPRIADLESAFSIEKITDEFFQQYKALFHNLSHHLHKHPLFQTQGIASTQLGANRFAKKLLGQIVFLYFLQKKGWLGAPKGASWGMGSRKFLRDRFERVAQGDGNYYRDFLQLLFYEALACQRPDQPDPGFYAPFQCRIPFLNGGLFEADYDWKAMPLDLPNSLFHNDEKSHQGDVGTGILDVFDRYNFTIKEDEPLDKEVAVDPEMLGKVFENMLEVTERKSKGAFYTPREIVHYMCQESLVFYLHQKLNAAGNAEMAVAEQPLPSAYAPSQDAETPYEAVPKADLELLIRSGHLAQEYDARVLNEGRQTQTYRYQLPESIRAHAFAIDAALATIKVCDPAIGSGAFPVGLLHEIVNARLALAPHCGTSPSTYDLKRHTIAESIYGVDLDASAIDIARLRLWLSLIVDEQDFDTIEPLPNLDYKIVQGDSLLGIGKDLFNIELINKLEADKREFFHTSDYARKAELAKTINSSFNQLTHGQQVFDFELYFSEVWHTQGGFDVVIGNPPYISAMALNKIYPKRELKQLKSKFKSAVGPVDIYILFFERSINLLSQRGSSMVSFISPNRYLSASYGKGLRDLIYKTTRIIKICDYSDIKVFKEASTYPVVSFIGATKQKKHSIEIEKFNSSYQISFKKILDIVDFEKFSGFSWGWLLNDKLTITDRIINCSVPITKFCQINATSTAKEADEFHDLINEKEGFKLVNTGTIDRYITTWGHESLIDKKKKFTTPFLETNSEKISNYRKTMYSSTKIIFAKIAIRTEAFLDENGCFASINTNCFHSFSSTINTKYILAWVNSTLFQFTYECFFDGLRMQGGYLLYSAPNLKNMFIHVATSEQQELISKIVDYVTLHYNLKRDILIPRFFDNLIDCVFFELLFPEELKATGKDILQHLGELTPLSEQMSQEEKLAVVQAEFQRLYDPQHPVRNRLETLDSVQVVRTVREALKQK